MGSAKETSQGIRNETSRINAIASEAIKSDEGGFCINEEDCREGLGCDENICRN
jgi:hypothetical protein